MMGALVGALALGGAIAAYAGPADAEAAAARLKPAGCGERRRVQGAGGVLQAAERVARGAVAGSYVADYLRGRVLPHRISDRAAGSDRVRALVRTHDVSGVAESGEDGVHRSWCRQNGGILNGSTRFDFTNYFEVLPANKLETALWAEADRMGGLAVTDANLTNQQGVVGSEVKQNVLNRPLGGFPWLDMPQVANTNWYNAHNFYGDIKDIEAAKLTEVQEFFKTYYAPNNAALAIVGDFDPAEAKRFVEKYFGPLKASSLPRATGY